MDYLLSDPNFSVIQNTLRAWHNDAALAGSPLSALGMVEHKRRTSANTADALRQILLDAINTLKPAEGKPDWLSPAWQPYLIFRAQIIDGWSHTQLASELAVSKSEYYRLRRKALARLAEALVSRERDVQQQRARQSFQARVLATVPTVMPVRDTDCFVGRDELRNRILHDIRESFQRRRTLRIALYGLPGMGKSTLAAELAADLQLQDTASAVIWLNAGKSATEEGLLVALAQAVRTTTMDNRFTHADLAQQIAETLAGQPIIVFIDDVWSMDCIRPLAQVNGIAALILTTRLPMVAHDPTNTSAIHVAELSVDDCMAVFRHFAPDLANQFRPAIEELIVLCGQLPMAITLAAKHLRRHAYGGQTRRALQFVEALRNRERRLALHADTLPKVRSLEAMIETSLSALGPRARTALAPLAALASSPHSFSPDAFHAITGESAEVMDELVDCGFVEPQLNDRYRIHRSLADFFLARGECDGGCQLRAAEYFAQVAINNYMRYAVLAQELPNLLQMLDTAQALGWSATSAKAGCVVVDYLHSVGQMNEALLWAEQIAINSKNIDTPALMIRAVCVQAKVCLDLGRVEDAETLFKPAIAVASATGIAEELPAAYEGLAKIAQLRNDSFTAAAYASQAIAAAEATGQSTYLPRLLAMQHRDRLSSIARERLDLAHTGWLLRSPAMRGWMFGFLMYSRGRTSQSVRVLQAALQHAQASGDLPAEVTVRAFTSLVLLAMARFEECEQMAQAALALREHVLLPRSLGFCYLSLGHVGYVRGQFDTTIENLLHWHAESIHTGRFESAALALLQASQCALCKDELLASAVTWSQDSLGLLKATGQSEFIPFPLAVGALAQAKLGNMSESQRLFDQAERMMTLDHAQSMHVRSLLGEALLLDRRYAHAEHLCRDLIRTANQYDFDEVNADAHFVLAQALVAQGQTQTALVIAHQALERYTVMHHFRRQMVKELVDSLGGNPHVEMAMPMPQKSQLDQ